MKCDAAVVQEKDAEFYDTIAGLYYSNQSIWIKWEIHVSQKDSKWYTLHKTARFKIF